jgi:hypothetical protein
MLKQRIVNVLTRQRNELLSDMNVIVNQEREATNAAFLKALETQRHEFHLEIEALRAELQAERASFLAALEELKYLSRHGSADAKFQNIESLVNTVDAALITLVLNGVPAAEA